MTRKLVVVSGGLGQPSSTRLLADALAGAVVAALDDPENGTDTEVTVVELREAAHDIVNNLLTGFASPSLQASLDAVTSADALIAVTPVFAASYSGLFKSFFDLLEPDALAGMPVLVAATGGTERHSLALDYALRPLFAYLRAGVVPTGVFAATGDWGAVDETGASGLLPRIDRAAAELALAVQHRAPRAEGSGEGDAFVPFAKLLAR
jgi:FMN reductase